MDGHQAWVGMAPAAGDPESPWSDSPDSGSSSDDVDEPGLGDDWDDVTQQGLWNDHGAVMMSLGGYPPGSSGSSSSSVSGDESSADDILMWGELEHVEQAPPLPSGAGAVRARGARRGGAEGRRRR